MGPYGNLLKMCQISNFPQIFCISALGISFSFKYMKTMVKSQQMVKSKIVSWFGPGIISKMNFFNNLTNCSTYYIVGKSKPTTLCTESSQTN